MVVVVCGKTWQKRQKACKNWWHIMSKSKFLFFFISEGCGVVFFIGQFSFFQGFFSVFSVRELKSFFAFLVLFFHRNYQLNVYTSFLSFMIILCTVHQDGLRKNIITIDDFVTSSLWQENWDSRKLTIKKQLRWSFLANS